MIHNLKPYPAYKDSSVPWLGEVPAHWEVRRLTNCIASLESGAREQSEAGAADGIPSLGGEHVGLEGQILKKNMRYVSRSFFDQLRKGRIEKGDVLLVKDGATIGKTALIRELPYPESAVNEHVFVLRAAQNCRAGYLYNSLRSPKVQEAIWQEVTGSAQPGLNSSFTKSITLSLPPLPEQTAIVRFLDHADRRIRRYIRAKQKLIALLDEQKQAIIHQAVTGQIDVRTGQPYPAYKPSGLEWLGEVPAHWELRPAKWYFREVDDRSETGSEELLSVSHITGVTPRSEKNVTMFKAESNIGHKLCRPGDLVINTMWAWMAALGVARQFGIVSPSYAVYRPHPSSRLLGEYADLLLRTTTYKNEYICRSTGIRSSRLRLYPEEFLRIKLLCPPLEEQHAIVEFVSKESTNARRTIDITHSEIDLLQE